MLKELNPDFLGFRGQLCDSSKARYKFNISLAKEVSKKIIKICLMNLDI